MSLISQLGVGPMDWHNTRFLSEIPQHFVRVKFRHDDNRAEVLAWLEANTVGRFAVESINTPGQHSWLVNVDVQIGFEDPAEATMYTMFFR